jgi:hypothetical protein
MHLITTASIAGVISRSDEIIDSGSSMMCASSTACGVDLLNGTSPVNIWYSVTPREYRSVRLSIASPLACSGDM